jgi:hypothetical protein
MSFSEQPPSKQWAALKYRGEKFAEVWFKPGGDLCALSFRIPSESFQIPGMAEQLTLENLLHAVAIVPDDVESWRHGEVTTSGTRGPETDLGKPLLAPPQHISHLEIDVHLKPPREAIVQEAPHDAEVSTAMWHDLEGRWKSILGLEASVETLRISMESLLVELEGLWKKPLTIEEKTHAPRADVAQWNKAKIRVHNAVPKMKDFIHRAVWAMGAPERRRLESLYSEHIQPHVPFPRIDDVLKRLDELRKDRQVLSAQGKTVYQDCRAILAELQGVLRTLHVNAANAQKKKAAAGSKGRFH